MTDLDTRRYFEEEKTAQLADALQHGDLSRAKLLLGRGVDANSLGKSGFRPVFFALGSSDPAALALIISAGARTNVKLENGDVPLLFSVRKEDPEYTRLLLASGADPNARASNNKPIIHEAILSDQPQQLRLLAKAGADLNVEWGGGSPVYGAAAALAWPMVTVLLELGASPAYRDRRGRDAGSILCEVVGRRKNGGRSTASLKEAHAALTARGHRPQCDL